MSHLFHLWTGVHSDRCYLAWLVLSPVGFLMPFSPPLPCPRWDSHRQPCLSWWGPRMWWVCFDWMCEKKCGLCKFGGTWSPAASLGEGSLRGGQPTLSVPPGSPLTALSHTHILACALIHGSCSFLSSIQTLVVIFIIVKQHMLVIKASEM